MLSYNDVFVELQDYILNTANIEKSIKSKIVYAKNDKSRVKENEKCLEKNIEKSELYIPKQQDSLFWCFYIIKNGETNYETINYKNTLLAKQLKIELVSAIRKNKDIVKMYKFDTISNLESNLANENNLTVKTFLTLCAIENINIIYVRNKTYYELFVNDTGIIYIVHEIPVQSKYHNKYGFELATPEMANNIRNTLYKIDNIDKPIKGASSYKVQDLLDICNKLSVDTIDKDTGKNKTKKDLYESILFHFHL